MSGYIAESKIQVVGHKSAVPEKYTSMGKFERLYGTAAKHFMTRALHHGEFPHGCKVMSRMNAKSGRLYIDQQRAIEFMDVRYRPRTNKKIHGENGRYVPLLPVADVPKEATQAQNGHDVPACTTEDIIPKHSLALEALVEEHKATNNLLQTMIGVSLEIRNELRIIRSNWE